MLMLLDMVWSNRENTIVPEQQPDYSHPPSSWRRRRAEIETTRTSWTPSAAVDVTQATVIAPDGESGGPLIINSTAPNFKDPDHNATAKYAEATESAVKAKHFHAWRIRNHQLSISPRVNKISDEGASPAQQGGTGPGKEDAAPTPQQVRAALLRATGLDIITDLKDSTESDVRNLKGKELCKIGSTMHLLFDSATKSKKKRQTEAEFRALQTWYHGLKNTEAGLWRVLRCAIDLPSLQFNDITTCFRKPKETLMQLAQQPKVAMEFAKILTHEANSAIPDLGATLDNACRAILD